MSKTIIVELDQNGIKKNIDVRADTLKITGDILKELKINEETALLFFKNEPIPYDEPINCFEINDGDFRILKVIFDE
jgi:hypothetical protein